MFTWGAGSNFKDHITPGWTKKFYGGTPVDKHDGGKSKMEEEQTQAAQQQEQQSESRAKCYNLRSGRKITDEPDVFDVLMILQYIRGYRTSVQTEQDTSEPVRSKVQDWLATSQEFET